MLEIHGLSLGMVQAYLLASARGFILVDAGMPGFENRVLRRIRSLDGGELRLIFITHAHIDHYGSAAALRRATGAPIAIHHADVNTMAMGRSPLGDPRGMGRIVGAVMPLIERIVPLEPTEADIVLKDGDSLDDYGIDAYVLHTPGHTLGSSSLIVEGKYAFVGDLLSTYRKPHVQRLFAQDWSAIGQSLDRLEAGKPELIYSGHGKRPLTLQELIGLRKAR
ncbi:MAG: MBL fold metallo-hydrolase [Anaerolineales bacterium]|jgi:hydroxyacylglutathione hydrolase